MGKKKEKIDIPKSVKDLKMSQKKFAKEHNISFKGMSKKEKKKAIKDLKYQYAEASIDGLNRAVKIIADDKVSDKQIEKIKLGIDNIIIQPDIMKIIAKIYQDDPSSYQNLIYLPNMLLNTLVYYSSEDLSDDEKEIAASLDHEGLIKFCERILKKPTKVYKSCGICQSAAFQLAAIVPSAKILKNNKWYKNLLNGLYLVTENDTINVDSVIKAITKLDKKKIIKRSELEDSVYLSFMLMKHSNKHSKRTDTQKELHDTLIDDTLVYLNKMKSSKCKDVLKKYIKHRRTAENYKNDSKRSIKFADYANSNSQYDNLKKVILLLIEQDSSCEPYLQ